MYLAVFLGAASLTAGCEPALVDFTATAVHLLGPIMQDGRFLPSEVNAPKPCH
jgi:hypothetical protein